MKRSRYYLAILFLFLIHDASASEENWMDQSLNFTYNHIFFFLAGIVVLGAILILAKLMNDLLYYQKRAYMAAEMDAMELEKQNRPSFLKRLYTKAWALVPIEKESDIDLGHSFDGIHELDNRLPPWWVYMFYLTIIWAIAYIYVSHYRENSMTQNEEYYVEMKIAEKAKKEYLAKQANTVDESNVVLLTDQASLESGAKTFKSYCAACHGQEGQGGVGPNMTDDYWIHGGSTEAIFKTIKYGVPEKGMIAWKSQLQPSSIQRLTSYIKSIHNTNPPNPKKAQGVIYKEELSMNSEGDE